MTHAGDGESAAYSFGKTPQMMEFFSELLGYDYAWPKYDQITLRNFWGAMETAAMVGFTEASLHNAGGMADDAPQLQATQPFEGYFDAPIDVEITTASGSRVHTIRVH